MPRLKLGTIYQDAYTGYTGVATLRHTEMGGRTLISLSGKVNDKGELPAHIWLAVDRLRDEKGREVSLPPLSKSEIEFGKQYRDRHTGFVGVATERQDHVDGCLQYTIEAKADPATGECKAYRFDDARLIDVETGKNGTSTPAPKGPADIHRVR